MKSLIFTVFTTVALFVSTAGFAQSSGWSSKPAGSTLTNSTLSSSPAMKSKSPFAATPGLGATPGLYGAPAAQSGLYGTPAGTLSHNRHVRHYQMHTDANNPLLHPQTGAGSSMGFSTPSSHLTSPATMTPMTTMSK